MSSEQRHFVSMKDWPKYHFVSKVFESDHYLFFTLHYNDVVRNGIYDKKKSKTYIADSKNVELHLYRWEMYGINNDIHNFIQFAPHYKNDKEEIVASVSALEVVNWFRENPDKAKQLPAHLQKLKDIKETDNPLVMIAKLKD